MGLLVVVGMMSILCVAVNLRAFLEMNRQSIENQKLNSEIEQLTSVSVSLQEEIKNLKGDSRTIEKEARKIGMGRPNEKILVPMN
jgi:cell division protein FtsB